MGKHYQIVTLRRGYIEFEATLDSGASWRRNWDLHCSGLFWDNRDESRSCVYPLRQPERILYHHWIDSQQYCRYLFIPTTLFRFLYKLYRARNRRRLAKLLLPLLPPVLLTFIPL